MKKTKKYLIEGGIFVFTFALTLFLFNNITRDAYAIDIPDSSDYTCGSNYKMQIVYNGIYGCCPNDYDFVCEAGRGCGSCKKYIGEGSLNDEEFKREMESKCPGGHIEKLDGTYDVVCIIGVTVAQKISNDDGTNPSSGGINSDIGGDGTNPGSDETNIDTPDNQEITDNVLTATFVGGGYKNSSDNNNNTNGCILENGASSCNVQAFGFINTDGVEYEYWQCGDKKVNPYERFSISTDTICSAMKKVAGSIDETDDNTSKGDSTPSKDTSGSKTTNVDKTDDELTSNSKTGSIMITIAYIVTIFTLGFGAVYYYRYRKQN